MTEGAVLPGKLRDGLRERLNLAFFEDCKIFEVRQTGCDVENLQPAIIDVARKVFARQVAYAKAGHRKRGQHADAVAGVGAPDGRIACLEPPGQQRVQVRVMSKGEERPCMKIARRQPGAGRR